MGGKDFERLAPGNVPYPHRLIKTTRSKEVRLVVEVNAKYEIGVSFQNFDCSALGEIIFKDDERLGYRKYLTRL